MNFRERLFVNTKSTSFKMMIAMSVFYGIIFGGITQIDSMINGETDLKNFIFSIIATTIAYGVMFLLVMMIVYNSQGIKMMMTLGMSRKNLVKCWRDFHLYNLVIGTLGTVIVLVLVQLSDSKYLSYRVLDVDFNGPGIIGFIKYLVTVVALFTALMGILNIVAQVGNHFGWRWVVNLVIGLVAILFLVGPFMINVITWGSGYSLMMVGVIITIIVTFGLSHQLVKTMEVKR